MDRVVQSGKVELIVPLLKSEDARLRQAGLLALTGMFKGSALPAHSFAARMTPADVASSKRPAATDDRWDALADL